MTNYVLNIEAGTKSKMNLRHKQCIYLPQTVFIMQKTCKDKNIKKQATLGAFGYTKIYS